MKAHTPLFSVCTLCRVLGVSTLFQAVPASNHTVESDTSGSTIIWRASLSKRNPNRVWVEGITYLACQQGWLYLAVWLDLLNRKVVWVGHCAVACIHN